MKRLWLALTLAAAAACFDLSSPVPSILVVTPVLDSLFVADTLPARTVKLLDANNQLLDPGPVFWTIDPQSVATVDSLTGKIVGVGKGVAVVTAHAANLTRPALVAVSRPLELTLLMDTVVVMPGDTINLQPFLAIKQKVPASIILRFDSSSAPTVYTVDTLNGLVTAHGTGGPVRYVARITDGTYSVADSGGVIVLTINDTSEAGHFFMTATGTAIRHQGGPAVALNYLKLNGINLAFRLTDSLISADSSQYEKVILTLKDSVIAAGTFDLDSINPQEAVTQISQLNAFCNPHRPWAFWSSILPGPGFQVYSHSTPPDSIAGHLVITRLAPAASGGSVISGRYLFIGQRTDLYYDALGAETIRGTFVAPLRTHRDTCQG